jgi:hypothetical protein
VYLKRKNLQKWALVAELVSAVAIVVTLAFLVVEMRANTTAIENQTYQELTQQLNNYRTNVMESDYPYALEKLLTNGWENLDRIDKLKLLMLRHNLYAIYEMAYYSHKRGVFGEDEWARFQNAICVAYRSDVQRGIWDSRAAQGQMVLQGNLTPEFGQFIIDSCK